MGLYGDSEVQGQGTAVDVVGAAAGTCRVQATVGRLVTTTEVAFVSR